MTITPGNITFDCDDTLAVAGFWSAALGRDLADGPTPYFCSIPPTETGQPGWFFIKVPEAKDVKNRVHIDFASDDPRADIDRLLELGASKLGDHDEWGHSWTTLADPEGNEFCVSRVAT
ncbi:MAG: VOC family protein [Actinomycetota bacterium]|nr:VOC family protein [Actinomycetota bacterium]